MSLWAAVEVPKLELGNQEWSGQRQRFPSWSLGTRNGPGSGRGSQAGAWEPGINHSPGTSDLTNSLKAASCRAIVFSGP